MRRYSSRFRFLSWPPIFMAALLGLTFILQLKLNPSVTNMLPQAGTSAYVGRRIIAGDLLYKDIWDYKLPGVYLLDAAFLAVLGRTHWAIWWGHLAWLGITALTANAVFRKTLNDWMAFLCATIFLLTIHSSEFQPGINLSETYALLPQFLAMLYLINYLKSQKPIFLWLLGSATALAFCFNLDSIIVGIILSVFLVWHVHKRGARSSALIRLMLGFAIPIMAMLIYWGNHQAISDLGGVIAGQISLYRIGDLSVQKLVDGIRQVVVAMPYAALFLVCMVGVGLNLEISQKKVRKAESPLTPDPEVSQNIRSATVWMVAYALPISFILIILRMPPGDLSYINLAPALSLGMGLGFMTLGRLKQVQGFQRQLRWSLWGLGSVMSVAWFLSVVPTVFPWKPELSLLMDGQGWSSIAVSDTMEYIFSNSEFDDQVLVYGSDGSMNFITGRRSPSRYPSALSLFLPGYRTAERLEEYVSELRASPPAMILLSKPSILGLPSLESDVDEICRECSPEVIAGIREIQTFVFDHYTPAWDGETWKVFVFSD